MGQWREMLDGVRDDLPPVADRVDWVAKWRVVEGFRERHDSAPDDAKLRAIDLQYHDVRPRSRWPSAWGCAKCSNDEQSVKPCTTRRRAPGPIFRGQCVARFPDEIVAANWDSVVFDVGDGPLQRVPMLDPLRGTASS